MYRPRAYTIDDAGVLHAVLRGRSFATIATTVGGEIQFAYAPVLVDSTPAPLGGIRFHLARANPLAERAGARMHMGLLGADAYVSPDWYKTGSFVPTWNYIAVEGSGVARELDADELRQLVVDLTAEHEARLRPKEPWTLDSISEDRTAVLLKGIRGFALAFESLEGKFKLSQDKLPADVAGAIAGLELRGDPASLAIACAMRETPR